MALIKSRPRLKVLVPGEIHPGSTFLAQVLVDAKRAVPIDFLRVSFEGIERAQIGDGQYARTARHVRLRRQADLIGAGTLGRGEQRLDCTIELPADIPPSYAGRYAKSEYLLTVHASIPWWPDAKQVFEIPVRLPPIDAAASPRTFSSAPDGPGASEPHAEVSISDQILSPGHDLVGAVALSNVAYNNYTEVELRLEQRESCHVNGEHRVTTAESFEVTLVARDASEGESIPFRIRIPELAPTAAGTNWRVGWALIVRVKRRLASSLAMEIPVVVLPRGSTRPKPSRRGVQSIGSARVHAIWQQVAAEQGFALAGDTLERRLGDVEVNVRREHRGDAGVFLVARLRYPSLQLALDGGRVEGVWRFLGRREQLTWPEPGYYVSGRELAQVEPFARELGVRPGSVQLADISDEQLTLEQQSSGQSHKALSNFVRQASAVAARFERARSAIVAPSAFRGTPEQSWHALVESLRGRLETSRMAVFGSLFGRDASVVTEWTQDGEPLATHVVLQTELPVPEHQQRTYTKEQLHHLGDAGEGAAHKLLKELLESALAVEVRAREVRVSLSAPLLSTEAALDALATASELELALRGRAGAYR